MKPIGKMSQFELAAFIQSHLESMGIRVVLSGGSVVAFYTNNIYVSKDLDLINIHIAKRNEIRKGMEQIGFSEIDRFFKNPESEFFVEFPPGPLSIGSYSVDEIAEITFPTGILKLLTPTDCVKDRLAAYYHWSDLQSLEQALLVAINQDVDFKDIKEWSKKEGMVGKFEVFKSRLKK